MAEQRKRRRESAERESHSCRARRCLETAIVLVAVVALAALCFELGWLPSLCRTNDQLGIVTYRSPSDADGDGVDDQTDILQAARAYVATRPAYGIAYYQGGWPTDGRGVCTDVVASSLLGAGYDLRELVNEDILADQSCYGIDQPDENIDYRRVRNLSVFFGRHAASLTTDVHDVDQWQGGDIVVFGSDGGTHIGVVSDRRDLAGVPFLIHHERPLQLSYEEDALLWRAGDVTAHYRFG